MNKTTSNVSVICFENISYPYFSTGVTYDISNKHRLGYTATKETRIFSKRKAKWILCTDLNENLVSMYDAPVEYGTILTE